MTIGTLTREDTGTGSTLRVADIATEIERLDGAATDARFIAVDPHAAQRCGVDGCREIHTSALIAPTAEELGATDDEGMPLTPIAALYDWPTWLDEVHHANAEWSDVRVDLHDWPDRFTTDTTLWDDELRALCEPAQISDAYLYSEARTLALMVVGNAEQHASVYAELAPERLEATTLRTPADRSDVEAMTARVNSRLRAIAPMPPASSNTERNPGADQMNESTPRRNSAVEPDGWVRSTRWTRALVRIVRGKRGA